jgi:hypothetical protein
MGIEIFIPTNLLPCIGLTYRMLAIVGISFIARAHICLAVHTWEEFSKDDVNLTKTTFKLLFA